MAKARKKINNNYQTVKDWFEKYKKLLVRIAIAIGVVLALWIYPFTRSYLEYPFHFVRCGLQAPIVSIGIAGAPRYYLPGEKNYRVGLSSQFFCTEKEAQDAGVAQGRGSR